MTIRDIVATSILCAEFKRRIELARTLPQMLPVLKSQHERMMDRAQDILALYQQGLDPDVPDPWDVTSQLLVQEMEKEDIQTMVVGVTPKGVAWCVALMLANSAENFEKPCSMLMAFLNAHKDPKDPMYLEDDVERWIMGVNIFTCAKLKGEQYAGCD